MTDFDPTTNRIPLGLLTSEEQAALMEWPHGWQMLDHGYWVNRLKPTWLPPNVYRGKPAPAKVAYQDEAALHELKHIYTSAEVQHLLDNRPTWEQWKEILAAGYKQKARADRLEAALKFYADPDTYEQNSEPPYQEGFTAIEIDEGDRARTTLAELKGEQQ